jgi:hypothetical protein
MAALPVKNFCFALLAAVALLATAAAASAQVDKVMADAEGIT